MELLKAEADERLKTVRSSLVAAAVGIGTTSRFDAYLRIAFGLKKPADLYLRNLYAMGDRHELSGVAHLEGVTGRLFVATGEFQKMYQKGRWTCHPDGEDDDSIIEVKTRAPDPKGGGEILPAYETKDKNWWKHMPQMQQNMFLTDRERCFFCCYVIGGESRIWEIYRSDAYLKELHGRLDEFHAYIDGQAMCPKRISKKPVMPDVQFRVISGASLKDYDDDPMAGF